VESILGKAEVWSRYARVTVRKGYKFLSDHWIAIKILHEFPEALFHGVDVELILGVEKVWSRQARVTVRKGRNFGSKRWIAIKILQEFLDVVFLGVEQETLPGEEVWSGQTRVTI